MKIKPIKIGKKFVGENYPCYIIAEIGSNFDGSFSKAKKMIKLAKDTGADAAKFQEKDLKPKRHFNQGGKSQFGMFIRMQNFLWLGIKN